MPKILTGGLTTVGSIRIILNQKFDEVSPDKFAQLVADAPD
jgi:hypothetical protein